MEPGTGRYCPQCHVCRSKEYVGDFEKILQNDDVGITVYRYKSCKPPQRSRYELQKVDPGEIFILQTAKNIVELNLDIFAKQLAKCKTDCPRCKELMRRAETAFKDAPSVHKLGVKGVTGLCGHAYKGPQVCCPPCKNIVDKFLEYTARAHVDPDSVRLQTYLDRSAMKPKPPEIEDAVKSLVELQNKEREAKEKDLTETESKVKQSKDKEKGAKEKESKEKELKDKRLKEKELKQQELKEKQLKEKELIDKLFKGKELNGKELKEKRSKEKELNGKELKEKRLKEKKLKTSEVKEKKAKGKGKETKESKLKKKELKEKELKEKEAKEKAKKEQQDKENMDRTQKSANSSGLRSTSSKSKISKRSPKGSPKGSRKGSPKGSPKESRKGSPKESRKGSPASSKADKKEKDKDPAGKLIKKKPESSKASSRESSAQKKLDKKQMKVMKQLLSDQRDVELRNERNAKEFEKERKNLEQQATAAQKKLQKAQTYFDRVLEIIAMQSRMRIMNDSSFVSFGSQLSNIGLPEADIRSIIIGDKIYKNFPDRPEIPGIEPKTTVSLKKGLPRPPSPTPSPTAVSPASSSSQANTYVKDGVLRYKLSDPTYIDKGWTQLPKEKVVRKVSVYKMRPARPEFDWFELNRHNGRMEYSTGEGLAEFGEDGAARVFYKNGDLALDYYAAEEVNAGKRLVLYSTEKGERTVLAMFDYSGNGVVYDHAGNERLKYNQNDGVVLDRSLGPKTHWKWHSLNHTPELLTVMTDNQLLYKDPRILALGVNKENSTYSAKVPIAKSDPYMKNVEFQNSLKYFETQNASKYTTYQIKMKALRINKYFSLRIMDQSAVYLLYTDGQTRFKINMGLVLDPNTIIDQDLVEVAEVGSGLDRLPARSQSVEQLQKILLRTRKNERLRLQRKRRLNPPKSWEDIGVAEPSASRPIDQNTYTLFDPSDIVMCGIPSQSLPSEHDYFESCCPMGDVCQCP